MTQHTVSDRNNEEPVSLIDVPMHHSNHLELNIKKILKHKGMSQRELAEKTGIASQQIQRYCAGKTIPSLKLLNIIAAALDVPIMDLFETENKSDQDAFEKRIIESELLVELLALGMNLNDDQLKKIIDMIRAFGIEPQPTHKK